MAYVEHLPSKNRRDFTCIHSATTISLEDATKFKQDSKLQSKTLQSMQMIGEKEYTQFGITCETRLQGINSYLEGIATLFNENDDPIEVFDQLIQADQSIGSTDYSLNSEIAKFVAHHVPRLKKQYKYFLFKKHKIGTPNAFCNGLITDTEKFYGNTDEKNEIIEEAGCASCPTIIHSIKELYDLQPKCYPTVEFVDLSAKNVRILPKEIGNLTKLYRLDLNANKLIEIPNEIGNLSELNELWLGNNEIVALPPEISKLKQLKVLYLASNKLKNLPQEIAELTHLQNLDFRDNQISTLSRKICARIKKNQIETDVDIDALCSKMR